MTLDRDTLIELDRRVRADRQEARGNRDRFVSNREVSQFYAGQVRDLNVIISWLRAQAAIDGITL